MAKRRTIARVLGGGKIVVSIDRSFDSTHITLQTDCIGLSGPSTLVAEALQDIVDFINENRD